MMMGVSGPPSSQGSPATTPSPLSPYGSQDSLDQQQEPTIATAAILGAITATEVKARLDHVIEFQGRFGHDH